MREIFVFGSNLAGRHGKGAALAALKYHGAIYGQGWGPQGHSYAIPTKDETLQTLSLDVIKKSVDEFIDHVEDMQGFGYIFNVTPVGCGLAGYKPAQIAPMFKLALDLPNVRLPIEFLEVLNA